MTYLNFLREHNADSAAASPGREFDRHLAERIGRGDREALAMLLDRHLGAVYGYLARRLGPGHEETAAEITCATFEEALRHLRRLRPLRQVQGRLYARGSAFIPSQLWLIHQAGVLLARSRGKAEDAGPPASDSVQLTNLRRVINALPSRKASILSLALFEGLSAQEIATASGVSVSRAMKLLRGSLKRASAAIESDAAEESQHG